MLIFIFLILILILMLHIVVTHFKKQELVSQAVFAAFSGWIGKGDISSIAENGLRCVKIYK